MNILKIKKYSLIVFLASLSMWLFAGIIHEIIFEKFFKSHAGAAHEGTIIIFIAYLVLTLLMTYIFTKLKIGTNLLIEGLKFGGLIGLLWVFPHELALAGAHDKPLLYVFANAVIHIVEQGFGGLVIAFLYGKFILNPNKQTGAI